MQKNKKNTKANLLYKYIYVDNIEFKEESNITMTYSKDFRDQFKEFKI